jgi:hypothetical protein
MEGHHMKLRSLVLFGAGVATGVAIMRRLTEDDPDIAHGPQHRAPASNPALRVFSEQTARLSDRATVMSLDAIRRARSVLQERISANEFDDDAAWR